MSLATFARRLLPGRRRRDGQAGAAPADDRVTVDEGLLRRLERLTLSPRHRVRAWGAGVSRSSTTP